MLTAYFPARRFAALIADSLKTNCITPHFCILENLLMVKFGGSLFRCLGNLQVNPVQAGCMECCPLINLPDTEIDNWPR